MTSHDAPEAQAEPPLPARAMQWLSDHKATLRRIGLPLAIMLFGGGLFLSLRAEPDIFQRLQWAPFLILLLIGAPIQTVFNGWVLVQSAKFAGKKMKFSIAVEVTLLGSAANMLPIPGAILSKVGALKAHGVSAMKITHILLLTTLIWGSLSFMWAGGAMWLLGEVSIALLMTGVGLVMGMTAFFSRGKAGNHGALTNIVLARLFNLPLDTLRYVVLFAVVGVGLDAVQGSTFSIAGFVSTASMIFPAGIGIYEATVAVLSSVILVDPALAFLTAIVGRIAYLCGLTLTGLGLLLASPSLRNKMRSS